MEYICNNGFNRHAMASTTTAISKHFINDTCHCSFRRQQDVKRHKCTTIYLSSSLTRRVTTSSVWTASHPRMAGLKFKCVCVCVCVCAW